MPCQKEVKSRLRTKALRWRERDHAWWRATRGVKKSLHKVWDLWSIWRIPMKEKNSKISAGNSMRSASRLEIGYSQASRQDNVLTAAGNSMREDQLPTQSDEWKHSNSYSTRRLFASTPELRNMEFKNHQYVSNIFQCLQKRLGLSASDASFSMQAYKTKVLTWECSCLRRWKPPSILGRIIWRVRRSTWTQNSMRLKDCSTLLRS